MRFDASAVGSPCDCDNRTDKRANRPSVSHSHTNGNTWPNSHATVTDRYDDSDTNADKHTDGHGHPYCHATAADRHADFCGKTHQYCQANCGSRANRRRSTTGVQNYYDLQDELR